MRVGKLRAPSSMIAVVATVAIAACAGDPAGPMPAIAIVLSPGTVSVTQGGTNTVNLSLSRSGGFTGDVSIAVEGGSGILTTVGPPSLDPSVSAALITIRAANSTSPGVDTLTVRATGTGVTPATAPLVLTVVAAAR